MKLLTSSERIRLCREVGDLPAELVRDGPARIAADADVLSALRGM
jgi:hypothetical protein